MTPVELPDNELVQQLTNPDTREQGFNQLILKYQERLYWHIRKMVTHHDDTDDVLQNTFVKIWHGLSKFRGDSSLYTWIYRIATNETLTFLKSKQRKKAFSIDEAESPIENTLKSDPFFDGNEIQVKLQSALMQLPDKQRLVFNMKYFDEMKYDEIASITGNSVGSLKASFHHAVKKIELFLKNDLI
jgi:RNA polymerase sigma-70 factor (ECF subfamily)